MKVKILKCSFEKSWYENKVGQVLDVTESDYSKEYYQLKGKRETGGYLLLKSDTEKIILHTKNET